jgi:Tfp pilus assembly protein FimV
VGDDEETAEVDSDRARLPVAEEPQLESAPVESEDESEDRRGWDHDVEC